jgi:hypothetical protein
LPALVPALVPVVMVPALVPMVMPPMMPAVALRITPKACKVRAGDPTCDAPSPSPPPNALY